MSYEHETGIRSFSSGLAAMEAALFFSTSKIYWHLALATLLTKSHSNGFAEFLYEDMAMQLWN